jgi:ferredoxin
MRILVDWDRCDGNGICAVEAPEVFHLDDDDELTLLQEHPAEDLRSTAVAAAASCPKRAITIES